MRKLLSPPTDDDLVQKFKVFFLSFKFLIFLSDQNIDEKSSMGTLGPSSLIKNNVVVILLDFVKFSSICLKSECSKSKTFDLKWKNSNKPAVKII